MLPSSCEWNWSFSWSRNFLPWMEQPESSLSWFKEPVTEMCSKQHDSSQLRFLLEPYQYCHMQASVSFFKVFLPSRFVYENVRIFYLLSVAACCSCLIFPEWPDYTFQVTVKYCNAWCFKGTQLYKLGHPQEIEYCVTLNNPHLYNSKANWVVQNV